MRIVCATFVVMGVMIVFASTVFPDILADKDKMAVRDGVLYLGKNPFMMRAVRVSEMALRSTAPSEWAATLARIADAGGNAVCFTLPGYAADGSLSPGTARTIKALMDAALWRRMGGLCRILPKKALDDKEKCLTMVRSAAAVLKNENRLVYWIDGPNADELVKAFREAAPGLVVAAKSGGDIEVVEKLVDKPPVRGKKSSRRPAKQTEKPLMLSGEIPPAERLGSVHFVLPGNEQSYVDLEAAMKNPAESAAWKPDNSTLSERERAEGFVSLFDGKTLDGWWFLGANTKGFAVENGAIVWKAEGGRALYTRDRYDNFILRLEWKINKGGNSGIYLRAPRAGRQSKIGMEFQLQGDAGQPVTNQTSGAIYDVVAPRVNATKSPGEWNTVEILLDGGRFRAVMNDQVVQETDLEQNDELRMRLRRGFIGLQDHGSFVAFRNIRIKRL
ncbi:MAG TPA: DUF1080 domain-containing protein [Candidatus Hydrogenedentes bacterium]|nr:DUF1080 domain-containing protein [Candidatus Hydrogenedentota bacterium]HPC16611.1 DUF1080 domain-containing protein [Candidatus Hydrogenedentota bacterium]HRT20939.1 DUF1080 domain-containing protein [Candidatus Hydrogenedentota bacterium]HRT63462.1 DUF1080 domain-containing protein [Candidatus Hydrogenedentota bacterium]